ncbi:M48 family peptidase [bacterium]|jgi:SprT-like protein|nr:M48 family peptidase [bacterium]
MSTSESKVPDLALIFAQINERHFDGFLDLPTLQWNSRLRSSAGRFFPGSRKWLIEFPPKIEIASYLIQEQRAHELIIDTLGHEMIHYWLWVRRRPYGHTSEFLAKMKAMGVSRYNSVPKVRPYKYIYHCQQCLKDFPARRKLGPLACAECCKLYNQGKYDIKYRLVLQG